MCSCVIRRGQNIRRFVASGRFTGYRAYRFGAGYWVGAIGASGEDAGD